MEDGKEQEVGIKIKFDNLDIPLTKLDGVKAKVQDP